MRKFAKESMMFPMLSLRMCVRTIHFTGISIPDTVHGVIYTRNGNKIVITNHAAAACKNIDNYHEFDP